jgi:hypothetical protein
MSEKILEVYLVRDKEFDWFFVVFGIIILFLIYLFLGLIFGFVSPESGGDNSSLYVPSQ